MQKIALWPLTAIGDGPGPLQGTWYMYFYIYRERERERERKRERERERKRRKRERGGGGCYSPNRRFCAQTECQGRIVKPRLAWRCEGTPSFWSKCCSISDVQIWARWKISEKIKTCHLKWNTCACMRARERERERERERGREDWVGGGGDIETVCVSVGMCVFV